MQFEQIKESTNFVHYGREVYSKLELTKSWLTIGNDDFFELYGFNWIPPYAMQQQVRRSL
jgi:hypothetical protein